MTIGVQLIARHRHQASLLIPHHWALRRHPRRHRQLLQATWTEQLTSALTPA